MARDIGGWLSGVRLPSQAGGPPTPGEGDPAEGAGRGRRLDVPADGPGSVARTGRRLAALCVDWLLAYGCSALTVTAGWMTADEFRYSMAGSTTVLALWAVIGIVGVRLVGVTPGQVLLGLTVGSVGDHEAVGIGRAAARVALLVLVVPALITDVDGRGLHDRWSRTAVVRR